jgi:hypothetical protein
MTRRYRFLSFAGAVLVLLIGTSLILRHISGDRLRERRLRATYPDKWSEMLGSEGDERVKALFGGEAGLAVVAIPDRLEISRAGPVVVEQATSPRSEVYPLVGDRVLVPEPARTTIISALLSPESYFWGVPKNCEPSYEVCLTFYRGSDRLDALLCFGCRMMLVVQNGRVIWIENFDFAQPTLLQTIKPLLPSHKGLQALDEVNDAILKKCRELLERKSETSR